MTTPVFVIHGIGNRDEAAFDRSVRTLTRDLGSISAHPVFWGDLGASYEWIAHTVPSAPTQVRANDDELSPDTRMLTEFLLRDGPIADGTDVRGAVIAARVPEVLLEAATGAGTAIREESGRADDVREALADTWPATQWLQLIDDAEVLRAVGAAVAGPIADRAATNQIDGPSLADAEIRGGEQTRGPDMRGFVKKRLTELDRVVGAVFGAAGGRLNTHLRTKFLPGVTQGVGDILVYQRHRDEIAQRVREVITAVDPALGRSPDRPVDVLAHSLGGVISVDMATADDSLWIRNLVTFGSQSPFFHVCDPRGGLLTRYTGDQAVPMPPSIGAWTNLWEPMDPVAFLAARIFRLSDGTAPRDIEVPHLASSGIWTHTDYWTLDSVSRAIGVALGVHN